MTSAENSDAITENVVNDFDILDFRGWRRTLPRLDFSAERISGLSHIRDRVGRVLVDDERVDLHRPSPTVSKQDRQSLENDIYLAGIASRVDASG